MQTSAAPTLSAAAGPAAVRERQGRWLMVAGGALLGTLGICIEEAGQGALMAVWFRCAFGALALTAWVALGGRWSLLRLGRRALTAAVAAGLLMLLNWGLFFAAIERTSIGVATVVFHIQPFWVMALGAWWLHEPVHRRQWLAGAVALLGLALASGLHETGTLTGEHLTGVLMCLGGSISYALVTLIAKSAQGASPLALAWVQCLVGALLLAWWPWVQGWPGTAAAWGWLAALGVLHTGLAYVLLYTGVARLPAGQVALLQFVYPAAALAVDWVVYGRALGVVQTFGLLLMLLALRFSGRPDRAGTARSPARR